MIPDVNEPLPKWAIDHSNGCYMEVGAQLCTRDGRRMGNGFVAKVHHPKGFVTVITDAGNRFTLNEDELKEMFYPPRYIMSINSGWVTYRIFTLSNRIN